MAEISMKRKARDMNGSNASDYDEPFIKATKTNENRRRSSFVRGKFNTSIKCSIYNNPDMLLLDRNRQITSARTVEKIWQSFKLWTK